MTGVMQSLALAAASVVLAAFAVACIGGGPDATEGERLLELEAKAHSLEESAEILADENARLREEVAALRQAQAEYVQQRQATQAAMEHGEAVADFEEGQEEQLSALEEGQDRIEHRLDALEARTGLLEDAEPQRTEIRDRSTRSEEQPEHLDTRLGELEYRVSKLEALLSPKKQVSKLSPETALEQTRKLAGPVGAEVYNIDSREPAERAILVLPPEPIAGNPLIVSLHGYGGNSADHSRYFPLHEQVPSRSFGLLLPNGLPDSDGNPAWNPTDESRNDGKASEDDFAYLSGLVARAMELQDFGPVYIFGYSNGGFMAYHLACKGLPGLRAVVSIAGTSYYEDSECEGTQPVSVLHIHGEQDRVIAFHGSWESELPATGPAVYYAGAREMYYRWAERAGCDTDLEESGADLDLDLAIEGAETGTFRFTAGCAEGATVEIWSSDEGGHAPDYGDDFIDALLDWLLSQE